MTRIIVFFLLIWSIAASAQDTAVDPDTTGYAFGIPKESEGIEGDSFLTDVGVKDNKETIAPDDLPRKLKKALSRGDQYKGWEKNPIVLDKNTSLYNVMVDDGDLTHIFGLDGNGNQVTFISYDRTKRADK